MACVQRCGVAAVEVLVEVPNEREDGDEEYRAFGAEVREEGERLGEVLEARGTSVRSPPVDGVHLAEGEDNKGLRVVQGCVAVGEGWGGSGVVDLFKRGVEGGGRDEGEDCADVFVLCFEELFGDLVWGKLRRDGGKGVSGRPCGVVVDWVIDFGGVRAGVCLGSEHIP